MLLRIGESGYSVLEVYIPFDLLENERITIATEEKMLLNELLSPSTQRKKLIIYGMPNTVVKYEITSTLSFQNPPDVRELSFLISGVTYD